MLRIPTEKLNLPCCSDADVIKSWKWFLSFITESEWEIRKNIIENKITVGFRTTEPFSESITEGTLVVIKDDVIGWYLYLIDMFINEPHKYEYFQGARVVPIFKRFGIDFDLLKQIGGIEKKVKDLLKRRSSEADAILFEILTALLWARNGYHVDFIPEKNGTKNPDILAKKKDKIWNIECKRQSKTSDYAYRETVKRQKMVSYISKALLERNIVLDIVFHVELETLPDTFLYDLLAEKLQLAIPGKIFSSSQVDIDLSFVDIFRIKSYLDKYLVKQNSPVLNILIGGKPVDNKGFTCGMYANFFRIGEGEVNNLFVLDVSHAFAIYCTCDAKEALLAKARDIKKQVSAAMQQFSSENTAVIHIGMETFDGPEVERTRFEKIQNTIENINPQNTKLRWIFCNYFQAYSPPDQNWVFDETVSTISAYFSPEPPLNIRLMIVPDDGDNADDISHWDRPLP